MTTRVALVTGAAGGIGAAVVRKLAAHDTKVAAVDRDADQLNKVVTDISGLEVEAFPTDVTEYGAVDAVVETVEQRLGPIEHLVNAAGVLRLGEVRAMSEQDWAETFAVNTTGVFHASQAVVKRMVSRGHGAIVTVASNAAGTPRAKMAAYSASKAAATMFTKSLGLEVAQYGVRCNVVAPGSTDTAMLHSMWSDDSGRQSTLDGNATDFRIGIPLGKLAQPEDIANAVMFLLSEAAGHVTLHDLTVDGGAGLGA